MSWSNLYLLVFGKPAVLFFCVEDPPGLTSRAWGWQLILETSILMGFLAPSRHGVLMAIAMPPRGRDPFLMVLKLCISG